jgi:hypothetical protein
VRYEYLRIAKAFLKKIYEVQMTLGEPRFVQAVKDFLNVLNPYTFRNTLAAMKHLFKFLGISEFLQDYKFKASIGQ